MKGMETFLIKKEVQWSASSQEITLVAMGPRSVDNGGSALFIQRETGEMRKRSCTGSPNPRETLHSFVQCFLPSGMRLIIVAKEMKELL